MNNEQIIWLQRQREKDPETDVHAHRVLAQMKQHIKPNEGRLRSAVQRARVVKGVAAKLKCLREMADIVADAFKPFVPCKAGCSHCCNMPTMLTQEEADVIGDEIKRSAAKPKRYTMKANHSFTGVPCPFLKAGRCSIYASRPIVCRLHVSLDRDDLLCNLASITRQPQWDSKQFHLAELMAFTDNGKRMPRLADIRDFFPSLP